MSDNRSILQTRPFQTFLLAADDLLELARPHYEAIEQSRGDLKKTGVVTRVVSNVWQSEKSLSIGSFITKYLAVEAFVNCVHADFRVREIKDIPESSFVGPIVNQRNKLSKKDFSSLHLGTRLYFIVSLCSEPMILPNCVFDEASDNWKEMMEIIDIRHSFTHAHMAQVKYEIKKVAPNEYHANDQFPENFWPVTSVGRDHRTFNYANARQLNKVISWAINNVRQALPTKLGDDYMTQETIQLPQ